MADQENARKNDWKDDPRLSDLDKNKLQFLSEFSQKMKTTPKSQLMPFLLTLNREASRLGIRFSDSETQRILTVLLSRMDPNEKKQAEMLIRARPQERGRT